MSKVRKEETRRLIKRIQYRIRQQKFFEEVWQEIEKENILTGKNEVGDKKDVS